MGSSQIGYFAQGPKVLNPNRIARAEKRAKRIDGIINALRDETSARRKERLGKSYFRLVCDDSADNDVPEEPFAEKALEDFIQWWHEGAEAGDTVSSEDRYRKNGLVVFSGDQTWGDSPDGEGYNHFRLMGTMGLLLLLDIR